MAIRDLKKLYTLNRNNEVVVFATNLKDFVSSIEKLEPNNKNVRNYAYYNREFKKRSIIELSGELGEQYKLQEVFNAD